MAVAAARNRELFGHATGSCLAGSSLQRIYKPTGRHQIRALGVLFMIEATLQITLIFQRKLSDLVFWGMLHPYKFVESRILTH